MVTVMMKMSFGWILAGILQRQAQQSPGVQQWGHSPGGVTQSRHRGVIRVGMGAGAGFLVRIEAEGGWVCTETPQEGQKCGPTLHPVTHRDNQSPGLEQDRIQAGNSSCPCPGKGTQQWISPQGLCWVSKDAEITQHGDSHSTAQPWCPTGHPHHSLRGLWGSGKINGSPRAGNGSPSLAQC